MLYIAGMLLVGIGVAHSYLGERYILIRLFRRGGLPKLFGGTAFTRNTLRFAWHITTLAWFGFAALLLQMATGGLEASMVARVIGVTFLLHAVVAFVPSRGRHLSWVVFLAVGAIALHASFL